MAAPDDKQRDLDRDRDHIVEAFKHGKPIGAIGEGIELLRAAPVAGVELTSNGLHEDAGVVTVGDGHLQLRHPRLGSLHRDDPPYLCRARGCQLPRRLSGRQDIGRGNDDQRHPALEPRGLLDGGHIGRPYERRQLPRLLR